MQHLKGRNNTLGDNPSRSFACVLPAAKIRVKYECMKEKCITETAFPSTTQPWPMTLDRVLG